MKQFAELYRQLDETTKTNRKIDAIVRYFEAANEDDIAWAIYFLIGKKIKRVLPPKLVRTWATTESNLPAWLFEESYQSVGDLAETVSLLVPTETESTAGSLTDWVDQLNRLATSPEVDRLASLNDFWKKVGRNEGFIFTKLLTGSLRVGVSRRLVTRAIAEAYHLPVDLIAHRLMGNWNPDKESLARLISADDGERESSQPYPFALAYAIEMTSAPAIESLEISQVQQIQESLGDSRHYLAEWKWDGIRLQIIRRKGETFLWSRGEERMEDRFPEIINACQHLPDGIVIDGELLAWRDERPLGFIDLQKRINRKSVGKKLLNDVPARVIAFDLLEVNGRDIRSLTLGERRLKLETLLQHDTIDSRFLTLSTEHENRDWASLFCIRKSSREMGAEGLMLKRRDSIYPVGRTRGYWWKWKTDPSTIDAVLIYAQRGHGRRANLYSDYTFALWEGEQLVPFAKAYSGLTDKEIRDVDRFVRDNTIDKFGPVRSVNPELVMELAFETIQASKRHKSGVAVRFPRIVRWRHDKKPRDANSLDELKALAHWSEQ